MNTKRWPTKIGWFVSKPPHPGVVYDRNGTILARNRPSFEIALVPEFLPEDDDTTEWDEEALEIEKVMGILRADTDQAVALRMAEIMFKKLGYDDFTRTVQKAGVDLQFRGSAGVCCARTRRRPPHQSRAAESVLP
ncbi:MAG: hypothetical protein IPK16_25365 [Anaerolineales bacterium]|nr:hypothetical protein [Anaerolineales bacterium]